MAIRLTSAQGVKRKRPLSPLASQRPVLVQAAARTAIALTADELDLSGDAIDAFTTAVGGRRELLATLAVADASQAADKVVSCLLDPDYATWSLRRICAYAGITVADLFASYKRALFIKAHVEATRIITAQLPPVVSDVMARALPTPVPCPRCWGTPATPDVAPCPQCHGEGTVLTPPDLDRQKVALELGRLLERKGGVMVQQNVTAGSQVTVNTPGSLEQLQQAVGDLLFAPDRRRAASPPLPTIVNADLVEPEPRGEAPASHPVRDDPAPREPRFPHEEEPPLPFPDEDEDEDDDPPLRT